MGHFEGLLGEQSSPAIVRAEHDVAASLGLQVKIWGVPGGWGRRYLPFGIAERHAATLDRDGRFPTAVLRTRTEGTGRICKPTRMPALVAMFTRALMAGERSTRFNESWDTVNRERRSAMPTSTKTP